MATINGAPRMLLSAEGRKYREAVLGAVLATHGAVKPLAGLLDVCLMATPPDRRRRDVDNLAKAILDGLTHAAVWNDDEQIIKLTVVKDMPDPSKVGGVLVFVREV